MANSCETFNEEIHVDDVGTLLEFEINDPKTDRPLNINDATSMSILLQRPAEDDQSLPTVSEKAADFITDGTDGRIGYVTQAGDLDLKGTWKTQCKVETPSGSWHSNVLKFKVESNLTPTNPVPV